WAGNPLMDEERRAFYEYNAALMEPWDGPAAIAFTNGRQIGATLDRNGLRPARYFVTRDERIVMASEMGVLPIPEKDIVTKWRLQPGKMLLVDLAEGRLIPDEEIKAALAKSHPYQEWLHNTQIVLEDLPPAQSRPALSNLNLFDLEGISTTKRLEARQPILTNSDLEKIRSISEVSDSHFKSLTLDATWAVENGAAGMKKALDNLCAQAEAAVRAGINIIIL